MLLGEPSLLSDPGVNSLYQDAFQSTSPTPSSLTVLGMTPVHARLLSSSEPEQNRWSAGQLPAFARRPLRFSEWCTLGIGSEFQDLYNDGALDGQKRWHNVAAILDNKVLDQEIVEKGLLDGQLENDARGRKGRGVMSVLSGLLSSDIPCKYIVARIGVLFLTAFRSGICHFLPGFSFAHFSDSTYMVIRYFSRPSAYPYFRASNKSGISRTSGDLLSRTAQFRS